MVDKERSAIRIFMKNLGEEFSDQGFETDASSFTASDGNLLFSTDEFSDEDNFRSHNASALGWNVSAATISDILAAGGLPLFYGHSVTLQDDWDDQFINNFSKGIARCLSQAGAAFIGGDLGMSDIWRYTGIAIGKKEADLSRRGAKAGDLIYMTGNVGAGNLEAALRLNSSSPSLKALLNMVNVNFPLRIKEASLIRKYAHCCIDSSDGVFRALSDLTRLSGQGFILHEISYHPQGMLACKILGKPEEVLFLGECGEYELVFTIPPESEHGFLTEAKEQRLLYNKLGVITSDKKLILQNGNKSLDLCGYKLFARNFKDVKEYISELSKFIEDGR